MGSNKTLLRNLGIASALVVIVIAILSQTNTIESDDLGNCMDTFPDHVFVSDRHCIDEMKKCQDEIQIAPNNQINFEGCFDKNGVMRK